MDNLTLSYLELFALKAYWKNHDLESLKDYIAINHYRNKRLTAASFQYEIGKEAIEGLADYFVLASFPEDDNLKEMLDKDLEKECFQSTNQVIDCQL